MSEADTKTLARLQNAFGRVRTAEANLADARRELRRMMRDDIDSGRVTQTELARALRVSRQRIRQMLDER